MGKMTSLPLDISQDGFLAIFFFQDVLVLGLLPQRLAALVYSTFNPLSHTKSATVPLEIKL